MNTYLFYRKTLILFVTLALAACFSFSAADSYAAVPDEKEVTAKAYTRQDLLSLNKAGKLKFPEGMKNIKKMENDSGDGILLSGTVKELSSGKIELKDEFDFTGKQVGRISIDGLSDRGIDVFVSVYLDDNSEPSAEFRLGSQMGKTKWANKGYHTKGVLGNNIKGRHKVSISLSFPDAKATKKTTVLLRMLELSESSIPVMYFTIDESKGTIGAMNGSEMHDVECYGDVTLEVPEGYKSEYTGAVEKTMKNLKLEYIRGRGNSTWMTDKKPYKVKFDKKQDLFGMGKNKHWVLLANRYDNSLVRNRMTYWLGKELGMEFTPQCVPVEVVMNDDYYGSYLLTEQIRVGESRVEIDDLEDNEASMNAKDSPTITGGYLLSMEPADEGDYNNVSTKRGASFYLESPGFEEHKNDAQKTYIKKYLQKVENTIYRKGLKDKNGRSYSEFLDVDSAVNYWWMQEFSANGDAYGSGSTYLYKKRNGKLFWGPLWDFDYVAWGDLDYSGYVPTGLDNTAMEWFDRMRRDRSYAKKVVKRWPVIKAKLTEIIKPGGLLDKYYEELKVSRQYDVSRWGKYGESMDFEILSEYNSMDEQAPDSYKGEIEQLRNWIRNRIAAVDEDINNFAPRYFTVRFKVKGKVVKKIKRLTGDRLGKLPKAPKRKKLVFKGWKTRDYGYLEPGMSVTENMTAVAKYVKKSKLKKAKRIYFGNYRVYHWYDKDEPEYMPSYTIKPRGARASIKWSSSNTSIATVTQQGVVRAKKPGKVKITARIRKAGKKGKRSFWIKFMDMNEDGINELSYLGINRTRLKMKKGTYRQIRVSMGEPPCSAGELRWISMDPKVASVDDNGVVTAKKKGLTYILVNDIESDLYAKCKVRVVGRKARKK